MAGGNLRQGRVDNSILCHYLDKIDPFFRIFLRNRGDWTRTVNYITAASQTAYKQEISTEVRTKRTVKGDRGMLTAPMLETMKVLPENMKKAAQEGFINATDLADYLTCKGMPFRTAMRESMRPWI